MSDPVILRLIIKDWRLNGNVLLLSIIGGLLSLGILMLGGQTAAVLGAGLLLTSLVLCASFLPMLNIVHERKKQTLAFLMSLPVSATQYGIAKLISTLGMFVIPWVTLVAGALYVILGRHVLPNGTIPTALILATLPFVGFCLIAGTVLVAESEAWGITASVAVNSSYWVVWYLIASRATYLTRDWTGPAAVWNSGAIAILAAEFAVILMALVITMLLQSRKREFV